MPPKFNRLLDSDYKRSKAHEKENLLGDYHDNESDEEDFFGGRPSSSRNVAKPDPKIQHVQNQVDDVVSIMHDNIGKVLDRGEKLEDLQEKSDDLAYSASMFRVSAKGLRSHFWWQECKMRVMLLVIVLVILLIIFIPIIVKSVNKN